MYWTNPADGEEDITRLIWFVNMSSGRDEGTEKEPVMCSKCNEVFETDSKYMQHYNEKHKAEETEQAQK